MENEQGQYSVFRSPVNNSSNLTQASYPDFNETVHFCGDPKTYKELVYTSRIRDTLNHTIEILTNDSKTSRLAQRNKNARTKVKIIPRPQNAWIIYRRDKSASHEFKNVKSWVASKIIGKRWKSESSEVIEYFVALSMVALDNHKRKYEDYKYQPRKVKTSKNHKRQPDDDNIQDLPQLKVVPPSPNNNYLPTPVSSIQHSPVTSQDDLESIDEILYPPSPASLNQYSPATFQDSFLEQMNMNNLLTPASSGENSPLAFQDSFLELLSSNEITFQDDSLEQMNILSSNEISPLTFQDGFLEQPNLLTPASSNSTFQYSFSEQQNLLTTSNQPDFLSGMYPDLSAITPTTCNNSSDNFSDFLPNADFFAAQPPSETITTNMDYQDFDLYPENEALITPTVESINIQDFVTPNNLEYVPFPINNATLISDLLGYYNDLPSSE